MPLGIRPCHLFSDLISICTWSYLQYFKAALAIADSFVNSPLQTNIPHELAIMWRCQGSKSRCGKMCLIYRCDCWKIYCWILLSIIQQHSLDEDLLTDESYQELMAGPWQWWLEAGRSKYPVVFKMAFDFLSIPSTSCECECCFSTASRTTTNNRNNLLPATIEALQLQENWLKNRMVTS
jgi:hypothetical protein